MAGYKDLKARLDRGDTIIHDAAVSTELQSMGVPMDFVACKLHSSLECRSDA